MNMKNTRFENSMALLAALIVIFGVASAANDALADDVRTFESTLNVEVSAIG